MSKFGWRVDTVLAQTMSKVEVLESIRVNKVKVDVAFEAIQTIRQEVKPNYLVVTPNGLHHMYLCLYTSIYNIF